MNQSTLYVAHPNIGRGPSPILELRHRLQVPKSSRREARVSVQEDNKYSWGEEEVELIKTCAVLSSSLGLSKSLSTSDICSIENANKIPRPWVSEDNINEDRIDGILPQRLEPISRSCSTWVAVGDVSTSQLPSPQARLGSSDIPAITAVDFIRSINKKVRQNYIKKRLEMSYRVLKRISDQNQGQVLSDKGANNVLSMLSSSPFAPREILSFLKKDVADTIVVPGVGIPSGSHGTSIVITALDVERNRGRPLSRYQRNRIIFDWLQTLEVEPLENVN